MKNEKTVVEESVARDIANKNLKDNSHVKWFKVLSVVKWFKVEDLWGGLCSNGSLFVFSLVLVIMWNLPVLVLTHWT